MFFKFVYLLTYLDVCPVGSPASHKQTCYHCLTCPEIRDCRRHPQQNQYVTEFQLSVVNLSKTEQNITAALLRLLTTRQLIGQLTRSITKTAAQIWQNLHTTNSFCECSFCH